MNHEGIEIKKKRILDAAHSIGFVVRHISIEGKKTVITFKKAEKPSEFVKSGPLQLERG